MVNTCSATRVPLYVAAILAATLHSSSAFQSPLGLRAPSALRAGSSACLARAAPRQGLLTVTGMAKWKLEDNALRSQKGKAFIEQIIKEHKKKASRASPPPPRVEVVDFSSMPPTLRKVEEDVMAAKSSLEKAEAVLWELREGVAAMQRKVQALDRERAIQTVTIAKAEEKRRGAEAEVRASTEDKESLVFAAKQAEVARLAGVKKQEEATLQDIVNRIAEAEAGKVQLEVKVPKAESVRTLAGDEYFKAEAKAKIERRAAAKKMAKMA